MASWAEQLQRELSGRGLAVASIPGKGRGLVASRSFFLREVIVCQEPYASTPNKISVGSSCDHCFAPGNLGLGKCSVCRVARYCGSACQKEEWKLHRLECQAIAALAEDREKMLTPTIRMMVRLILRRKLQNEKAIPSSGTDNYNLVDALESHISEVDENQLVLYAQMANLVQLILPSFELDLKEITHTFSKFACNAHTICDPELRPLGTGLYPVISIINHSCVPNAVLVFEGRAAYVRALQPISKNTEVSISYIETVAATMKRQNDLKQYFFTCTCPRCVKDSEEDALLEGYRCKDQKCDDFLLPDSGKMAYTCQKCSISRVGEEVKKMAPPPAPPPPRLPRTSSLRAAPLLPRPSCAAARPCVSLGSTKLMEKKEVLQPESSASGPCGGLQLVPCPKCGEKMVWAVSRSSKNRGKEYYKCPNNNGKYSTGCDTFMWKDQYETHLAGLHMEQDKKEERCVKFSNVHRTYPIVSYVDDHVLAHLAEMNKSLDQINKSILKSAAADEKFKMVLVACLMFFLGIFIAKNVI